MHIYGIYVLYRNNQIYLELYRCMIIYCENYIYIFCVFLFLMIFFATNAGSDVRWPFYKSQIKKELRWGISRWSLCAGGIYIKVPARPSLYTHTHTLHLKF